MEQGAVTTTTRFGRYEVKGELGTGGMAVVYRAYDPRLARDVAVKVLHPHLARDVESRARFEREARAAASLRHPNIVEVYEFSGADEPESYMVTELLEGPTLRRFVELHPGVPAEVVAAIGVVLCDALACAHAQGVVHRDVKPDNLMLQRGRLKLTDFGIAHVADGNGMTVTGQVLGSPAHMAPEQIEGAAVDARTDIFAAGTVLYLLATGKLPFVATTAHALMRKILECDFVDPLRVAPTIGHRFANIVKRALSRKPDDRQASAEAMRAELCAFLNEAGWEFPEQELSKYFEDPEGAKRTLVEALKPRLSTLGVEAQKRGDTGAAMGYFNRALAYDPGDQKVLAIVRSAARRRQVMRVARTVGLVGGAAALTALGAVVVVQSRAPKPPAALVAPQVLPEPTAVVPRMTETVRQEPPAVLSDDAAVEDPEAPRHTGSRRTAERAARAPEIVPAADLQGPTREVILVPFPRSVVYSTNGGQMVQWSSQNESQGQFHVGQRIHIVLVPGDPTYERREWTEIVPAGEGPYRIRVRLAQVNTSPGADGTAAVHDGGSSRLN